MDLTQCMWQLIIDSKSTGYVFILRCVVSGNGGRGIYMFHQTGVPSKLFGGLDRVLIFMIEKNLSEEDTY